MLAAEKARKSGAGERLEYRMRHKNGSWRFLESTASPVRGPRGEIEKLVIVNRDITERRQAEEKLAHNALHDALTGLANRALFVDRLQSALIRAQLHADYKFAVLFMDIDGLKVINESLGHAAGDELLIKLAKRLTSGFRSTDSVARTTIATANISADTKAVARFAGGEFTVLLEDVSSAANAIRIGRRIQERLATPLSVSGREVVTSISVGAVLASKTYAEAGDILRDGEIAMFRAKSKGKGNCEVFDAGMHRQALRRLQLETELRRAVDTGETIVHYQPIISLTTGQIVGFEALSRWKGPEGMISPGEFIPIAEETGLIRVLNHNLYTDACRQLRAWQAEFGANPPLMMSMNITGKQFADPGLPVEVQNILRETGVAPESVHLEIMETIAMADPAHALSLLTELKRIGVVLMIDDFGTGYSSLSRLPKFPIDALKIDRAFISNLIEDRESHEIVRLIVTLAHSLGLKVVAEGTETKEQVEAVRSLGCEMAQGYFFAKPVSDVEARELLVRQGGQALSASRGAGL
jgi:predicted signal transduction protein with EAL and GGDEF domain